MVTKTEQELVRTLPVPDIARLRAEIRKEIYDRLDADRAIALKVWNGVKLSEAEQFIAFCLGYIYTPKRAKPEGEL